MIDHVIIINLKRREDRYWFALGNLHTLGFDCNRCSDQVIRFVAHDGLDYPNMSAIHKAAVADGFSEFEIPFEYPERNRAASAWFWTWRCALRHIVEMGDKTVLLLLDDWLPKHGWTRERLNNLLYSCERDALEHGFRIMQLGHSVYANQRFEHTPFNSMLAKGLAGAFSMGAVLNADGAQLLLDVAAEAPATSTELTFAKLAKRQNDPEYFYGLWHTLDEICVYEYMWDSDIIDNLEEEGWE